MSFLPPITNLQAFEAVARRRSFALAALELHLTASAVSHQVARLETQLGVRLFERSAHGVRISVAGEQYLARVAGAISAISSATDDLRQGVTNSLYLHSAPSIAVLWLMPRISDFTSTHPEILLNLSAAHTHSDFALGQADIDIRYGVPNWPGLEIEPLFDERVLPLASPKFIQRHRLRRLEGLLDVPLIQSAVSVVQWPDWFARFCNSPPPDRYALRFDRAQMSIEAATQGLGVTLESAKIAAGHIADRKLKPVFGWDQSITVQAHFAVYPARHGRRPAVAAFLEWLRQQTTKPE
ncbi:MAG: LysR family transcriptional regulator [Betaproteobacteria bacterium]|nr:LysR family transcriptional regulator [Betaproteobacteria bacterium]